MIKDIIRVEGPVSVERYFRLCVARYYSSREPFGAEGDFITAPEYSQLFGEMVGVWCATVYEAMGRPAGFSLIELGPGRGTLMDDVLRASRLPASVHFVETSARLRERQKEAMEEVGVAPVWHETLAAVPAGPAIILANEFFDALPIQQFERRDGRWHERMVGLDESGELVFGLAPLPSSFPSPLVGEGGAQSRVGEDRARPATPPTRAARDLPHKGGGEVKEGGEVLELSPARAAAAREIAARSVPALVIDYGHGKTAFGDTLQAMTAHRFAGVLDAPGEDDLTAHVDFAALAQAVQEAGGTAHGPMEQGAFLKAMGIDVRAAQLAAKADAAQRGYIATSHDRLTNAAQMGRLFKVMAITPRTMAAPYPFGAS